MGAHPEIEMNKIYTLNELIDLGYKIVRLEGNRDLSPKNIDDKKKSLQVHGQFVPAIFVPAKKAHDEGLKVVDFLDGNPVPETDLGKCFALAEGNHRLMAHYELIKANDSLKEGVEPYNKEFYLTKALDENVSIADLLSGANINTTPWKGGDYVKGAAQSVTGKNYPLLEIISGLTSKGYSADAAAKWFTGKDGCASKVIMANAISGKLTKHQKAKLEVSDSNIKRGKRLLEAARSSFSDNFLKTRIMVDWIFNKYESADDSVKADEVKSIISFLTNIERTDVDMIEKAKGVTGGTSREQIIQDKLNELYAASKQNKL